MILEDNHNTRKPVYRFTSIIFPCLLFITINTNSHAEEINALATRNGAVLVSYTSEFGNRSSDNWIALGLIDESPDVGWSSKKGKAEGNEFTFELADEFSLSSLSFDNTNSGEAKSPGIAAKNVKVLSSTVSKTGPFTEVFSGEISSNTKTDLTLEEETKARWVRLIIDNNGGHTEYTTLMEFSAFGTLSGEPTDVTEISGVYDTSWGKFYIVFENGRLNGCYDYDNGTFTGSADGNLIDIVWREDRQVGTATLAITDDGSQFSGLWYINDKLEGLWIGEQLEDQSQGPKCTDRLLEMLDLDASDPFQEIIPEN